jgi:hypothetical protein
VMLAVILVIVVGTIRLIGSNANNVFSSVGDKVTTHESRATRQFWGCAPRLGPSHSWGGGAAPIIARQSSEAGYLAFPGSPQPLFPSSQIRPNEG